MDIQISSQSIQDYDVVVLGGGPSGCTAAAAAAREGANTLLVESTYALGGMGTNAIVPAWCPFSDGEKFIYSGMAKHVFIESKKGTPHIPEGQLDWVPIDAEHLMRVYDELVGSNGVTVLFGALFLSVNREASRERIESVNLATKGGVLTVRAKVFIDCTGDADVAVASGVGFSKGDEDTGSLQPATHCFVLSNVDTVAFRKINGANSFHSGQAECVIHPIVESGQFPEIKDKHFIGTIVAKGSMAFNSGHFYDVDATDPFTVSKAMAPGRSLAKAYRDALAEYYPEVFGESLVAKTGSVMGIRETRRIDGDYVLTLDDYEARQSFADEICRNAYFIDIHMARKEENEAYAGKRKEIPRYGRGESHGLPYRCLIPKHVDNLLVAGRSISVDRSVQGSIRVMPVCLSMGEAVGIASAMALTVDSAVRAIDTTSLREKLKGYGAYLPDFVDGSEA